MSQLAIKGGNPVRTRLFPSYNTIGEEEKLAVLEVLESGNLSQFLGAWSSDFLGGPQVKKLESKWCDHFGVAHAVTVNSNTSGLYTAMGAIGIQPGDEVIVTPYSMSASAIAPLMYGGVPVFADIDPVTFCLDPDSVRSKISSKTRAILVVHLFGHPAEMGKIMEIANEFNLFVVEDAAQAPLGIYKGRPVGTIGDIGVFSLNYHKHIHTGEGGVIVSNNKELAERCQLIRNHAENIVEHKKLEHLTNMIGANYRMTEIEASIGISQLDKLQGLLEQRIANVNYFNDKLKSFDTFEVQPFTDKTSRHCYYQCPVKFNPLRAGCSRNAFVNAVKSEIPSAVLRESAPLISAGYVRPLYLLPIFQNKNAFAYRAGYARNDISYDRGICPVVEKMHYENLFTHEFMRPGMTKDDMDDVIRAFDKVLSHSSELSD
ncbi:MAG TPA: DegT/DnrJ/EryC1/StrS family aminotransferase [Oligoflexia bacterium]|nr:DegT/DnrJ/EryC1/StrS family aminotransferase [Oligoflexia bacterium]HMP48504.1 DegT/DnrJ/EryC1/StrS family aminotransferase [Oligoflexia bacterium]